MEIKCQPWTTHLGAHLAIKEKEAHCSILNPAMTPGIVCRLDLTLEQILIEKSVSISITGVKNCDSAVRVWVTPDKRSRILFDPKYELKRLSTTQTIEIDLCLADCAALYVGLLVEGGSVGDSFHVQNISCALNCWPPLKRFVPSDTPMNDVLMVMSVRVFPRVFDALRTLDIPQVHFIGFREIELEKEIAAFVDSTMYDNYILVSDDVVVTPCALDNVRKGLMRYPIFTGYCNFYHSALAENLDADQTNVTVNVTSEPLTKKNGKFPVPDDYTFIDQQTVKSREEPFEAYLFGMAVSGMRRDYWLQFPFRSYHCVPNGSASDHHVSMRMYTRGHKIMSHRDTYCIHLKGSHSSLGFTWGRKQINYYATGEQVQAPAPNTIKKYKSIQHN